MSECFKSGGASFIFFRKDLIEDGLKVVRQCRLEFHLTTVCRVMKHETPSVQERPVECEHGAKIAGHPPALSAVDRVADDRMADFAEMHANLVCSARSDG